MAQTSDEANPARPRTPGVGDRLRVLVTGFGLFGDHGDNPSGPFAEAVADGLRSRGIDASFELLEVTYARARQFVDSAVADAVAAAARADAAIVAIHCGLSASREAICLERYAHNCRGDMADVAGACGPPRLEADGPPARETGLGLGRLRELMGPGSPPVAVSRDAGDYVCNALYYAALGRLSSRPGDDALFVHIPPLATAQAAAQGQRLADALVRLFRPDFGE